MVLGHPDGTLTHQPRGFASEDDHPPIAHILPARQITNRQLECLSWVKEGKSATDIGIILGLSGRTVEKHLTKICGHLGVRTRLQAVIRAREMGLIDQPGA
jgi:DNA-binding CsgD family transcriptional regulator